jgi:hypothetical protein
MKLANFDTSASLDFSKFLPDPFRPPPDRSNYEARRRISQLSGRVTGTLFYKNDKGTARQLSITSRVNFGPPPLPFFPPSPIIYDVRFQAGTAPAVLRVPISQVVNAGGADHFLVRIGSDRSGHFEFTTTVRAVDGKTFSGGSFVLDTFVPRSQAGYTKLADAASGDAKDRAKK